MTYPLLFTDAAIDRAANRLDRHRLGTMGSSELVRLIAPTLLAGLYDPATGNADGTPVRWTTTLARMDTSCH